ncbi:MAG: hypothetical protein ABI880_06605, partial [Acidobacteriota bacterium]
MREAAVVMVAVATMAMTQCAPAPHEVPPASAAAAQEELDQALLEISVTQLQDLYARRVYTVTQVVQWHLARIGRYNRIYRAVETVD